MAHKIKTVYRQGDVVLEPKNVTLPEDVKEIEPEGGRVILAHGEVTGHAHALQVGKAKQYVVGSSGNNQKEVLSVVGDEAVLRHEEHAPINLPQGSYEKRICREHTPGGERRVID